MFDDSWPHEVINESAEPRVVLIVDVLRPLPLVPSLLNNFIIYGLARSTYFHGVIRRVERSAFISTN
jgi:aspartate beta-hydroxylase/beta-hydroxylase